jgi:sulfate/thiosulfate transport system substrate-binding protein
MEMRSLKRRRTRPVSLVALALLASLGLVACGGTSEGSGSGEGGTVDLVAYSTPQTVYEETLEPGFNETPEGADVGFQNSFGSSGDQSRAVEAGQPADLVHLSLEPDMTRLVDAGMVAEDWNQGQYNGILQDSVVVFMVRPGNPEDITGWDDIVREDVEVLTPNPFTSGSARWNIMAAYGAQLEQGASEEEALEFVRQMLENTSVQDKAASDALTTFTSGKGDVLIGYENEAIRAQEAGEELDYVTPDETILIETPAAVTENADDPEAAQAFLDYLLSEDGQQGFADNGYRPVVPSVLEQNRDKFPEPKVLFTIEDLGGWETVATEFFDPESGSVAEIERSLGVATE